MVPVKSGHWGRLSLSLTLNSSALCCSRCSCRVPTGCCCCRLSESRRCRFVSVLSVSVSLSLSACWNWQFSESVLEFDTGFLTCVVGVLPVVDQCWSVVVGISCQNRLSKLVVGIAMVLLAILRIGCQYWFDIRKVLIKNRREIAYLRRWQCQ